MDRKKKQAKKASSPRSLVAHPPRVSYNKIAWWAEAADGDRDVTLHLARVNPGPNETYVVAREEDLPELHQKLLEICCDSETPHRKQVTGLMIEVEDQWHNCKIPIGKGKQEKVLWCDAVFTTESAIEKFLMPYYHSQRLLSDLEWAELRDSIRDSNTAAVGHVAPSVSRSLPGSPLYNQVALLSATASGTAEWETLGAYLQRKRKKKS